MAGTTSVNGPGMSETTSHLEVDVSFVRLRDGV